MTIYHVIIIGFALAAPLVCGLSPACAASLPSIIQLSTMAIAGTLGHAGSASRVSRGQHRHTDDVPGPQP